VESESKEMTKGMKKLEQIWSHFKIAPSFWNRLKGSIQIQALSLVVSGLYPKSGLSGTKALIKFNLVLSWPFFWPDLTMACASLTSQAFHLTSSASRLCISNFGLLRNSDVLGAIISHHL
jgi:hypothetical protein